MAVLQSNKPSRKPSYMILFFFAFYSGLKRQQRPAVLETRLSRNHGALLRAHWNFSNHQNTIALRGSRRAQNWTPMMPRDTSLSDSGCYIFFLVGLYCIFCQEIFVWGWNQRNIRHNKPPKCQTRFNFISKVINCIKYLL